MPYCLIKPLADAFKQALRDGKIDPEKLSEMSSEERRAYFSDIVGEENASKVNSLFENKLLLKDVQQGMINWAKQVTGIKPEVRADLVSRIMKMDERILNPVDQKAFLADLAATRLKTEVTLEEAKKITELSLELKNATANYGKNPARYGAARVALESYMSDLKHENNKLTLAEFKNNPLTNIPKIIERALGLQKSLRNIGDMSALFHQGLPTAFSNPVKWASNAAKSFRDLWDQLKVKGTNDDVMRALKAEIYSRQNAFNGTYKLEKIALGGMEENFPATLPEKLPIIGRVFKGFEVGYTGFMMRLRADLADKFTDIAVSKGEMVQDKDFAENIGKIVNSMTGRANLGKLEPAADTINVTFLGMRGLAAHIDTLTGHLLGTRLGPDPSGFARKVVAMNWLKTIGGIAAVLAIAKTINQNSVDLDPRSSAFGKIKAGNSTYDVSGGMAAIVTLAARLLSQSTKSSVSGKITEFGSGYGQQPATTAIWSFLQNRLTSPAGFIADMINHADAQGNPVTLLSELKSRFVPYIGSSYFDLAKDPNKADIFLGILANELGFFTTTNVPTAPKKGTMIPTNTTMSTGDLLSMVALYANAIHADPLTAFNRIFTGQQIVRVTDGTVIVQRMSLQTSSTIKSQLGKEKGLAGTKLKAMTLDHVIPLEIGGTNDVSNLRLVPKGVDVFNNPAENHLGKLLQEGKITKEEAQKLIVDFKDGKISRDEVTNR